MKNVLFVFLLSSAHIAFGYTNLGNGVLLSNGSPSDTQAAINAAQAGFKVQIPSGSFSWPTGVKISNAITLQGLSGCTLSVGTITAISVSSVTTGSTRVTGITFNGGGVYNGTVEMNGVKTSATFRIDNCVFTTGSDSVKGLFITTLGNAPGLIDHCNFTAGAGSEMIHNFGMGAGNLAGWRDDVIPGSGGFVFIENCTFSKYNQADQYFWGTHALESYYGARTVVRYCTLNYCALDQHGTAGSVGARWFEFYNNTFHVPNGGNQSAYITLRGGSGVVFNNNVTGGPNVGSGSINLYDENGGSSPLYLARGINQTYSPVYIWGNSSAMTAGSGSTNVVEGVDFFVSSTEPSSMIRSEVAADNGGRTYEYLPYVYPHPLDTSASPPTPNPSSTPAAPTNLRVVPSG